MLRTALLFALLLPAVAHEEGGSAMNAPAPPTDLNAIDFALADDELVSYEDQLFACVKLTLAPEEGEQKWVRAANVQYATDLPATAKVLPRKKAWGKKSLSKKDQACKEAGGVYVRLDRLQSFVNGAVDNATDAGDCEAPDAAGSAKPESPLAKGIKAWNDRFFNMDTAETRQNAELFHGRGSEPKHLAQEVTHFVMPLEVQARINERLATHRTLLLGDEGAGQGGTTGAHFLSGNVGFGNAGQASRACPCVPRRATRSLATAPASVLTAEGWDGGAARRTHALRLLVPCPQTPPRPALRMASALSRRVTRAPSALWPKSRRRKPLPLHPHPYPHPHPHPHPHVRVRRLP